MYQPSEQNDVLKVGGKISARRADRDPPSLIAKMAGYAFGSNPPYAPHISGAPDITPLLRQHASDREQRSPADRWIVEFAHKPQR